MARILLVEDNTMMRTVLRAAIERAGHQAVIAEDGQRGLDVATAEDFDLVVTDVEMPRMDGVEFVRRLKQAKPATKVLVISGRIEGPALQVTVRSLGAEGALDKPFTADKLVARIAEILG